MDGPFKALLVEDSRTDRLLLEEALSGNSLLQLELSHADRLRLALEALERGQFDVVLLDLGLPDSEGLETLTRLRECALEIPIVVLTGLADEALGIRAVQGGAQDYLVKGQLTGNVLARAIRYAMERKRAEREQVQLLRQLEKERARLDAVLQQMPAGVLMVEAPSGRVVLGNGQLELILRHSLEDLQESEPYAQWNGFHPDGRRYQPQEWPLARALGKSEVVPFEEIEFLRGDGSRATIHVSAAPIRGAGSQIVGGVAIFHDVTEFRRAQAELERSQERLNLSQRAGQIGTFEWVIATGQIVWTEELEVLYGYPPRGFLGRYEDWKTSIHPHDRERAEEEFFRALSGKDELETEFRIIRRDGATRWMHARARVYRDQGGVPQRMIGVNVDITSRKLAEEALKESDRRKDEFLAMLAHELRNPLAPIRYAMQLMRLIAPGDSNLEWARDVVDRQVRHMARLVDDLLDVSRITRGNINLVKEPLEVAVAVQDAIEAVRPLIDERKLRFEVKLPPQGPWVEGDPVRLAQVVGNLLHNAAKFTPEGGRISLKVEVENENVLILVGDTGTGISPEMLPRVFDPFVQGDRSLARSQGGLGIGLTLVRSLVHLHGGEVQARSDGPGRGSEFTVRLPVKERPASPEARQARITTSSPPRRILVVEDNCDSAESLGRWLRQAGHEVKVSPDGPSALKAAISFRPQVAVVDLGLPGMDGYQVARRLGECDGLSGVVLIALTGYGQEEDRRRSREAGFRHHLVKPADPATLLQLVEAMR
jgi:two-component system CheB/CheR fusion protein